MTKDPSKLPSKQDVALALLQTASSVYVHLDPRSDEVAVPASFKKQPQLVLQIGLNMTVPIPDLDVGASSITCTLSFNRTPQFCTLPYGAIYALVGEDGRGMVWPESVPAEVAAAADGRSPVAPSEKARRPKLGIAPEQTIKAGKASAKKRASASVSRTEAATEGGQVVGAKAADKAQKPTLKGTDETRSSSSATKKRELPPYLRVVK